jgi:Tfp pilus assembly protein PilV
MIPKPHPPIAPRTQRGITLVEALVALAIMAGGMLAYAAMQGTLRQNSDLARQRSEATRVAQERMELLRRFTTVAAAPGQPSYDGVQTALAVPVLGLTGNTTYNVSQAVVTSDDPPSKTLQVTVSWMDRSGQTQQVRLSSVLAGVSPALSGALAAPHGTSLVQRSRGRHPTIPYVAQELGNGSSAFRASATAVWVFNNRTGAIIGRCDVAPELATESLTAANLADCSHNTTGQFLSGFIRFARRTDGPALNFLDAENPGSSALNLSVALGVEENDDGSRPSVQCFDNAPETAAAAATRQVVGYHCIVFANSSPTWSGRSVIVPTGFSDVPDSAWALHNSNASAYKVCRYTPASSNSDEVPNAEHPLEYEDVAGNLVNQNFLVISAVKNCPTDGPADLDNGDFVNANTLQHQP